MKPFYVTSVLFISLSSLCYGCAPTMSPQLHTPTIPAQCAALRHTLLQSPQATENNTSIAVTQGQNIQAQQTYHDQCE